MRRVPLRRFPNEIVRRRQAAGAHNEVGRFVPGEITETVLPASVQPLALEDNDIAGGSQLSGRIKVYLPVGVERVVSQGDALTWNGDALLWNGEPLSWGGTDQIALTDDLQPLAAAFDDRGADEVVFGGKTFTVIESRTWPRRHCRATLLRET